MKQYILNSIIIFLFVFSLTSCGNNKSDDGHDHSETTAEVAENENQADEHDHPEGVTLTKEQAETVGLTFGDLSSIKETGFVSATGTMSLPPNAFASVSTKTDGLIQASKKFVEGDYIKKGQVVAYLENPEFIRMQQDYLETLAELKLRRLDVDRQRTLVEANAGVSKNLQDAQARVAALNAKRAGLARQLNYFGISPQRISSSNLTSRVAIYAPMSGYISTINFNNGMYAVSSSPLMEIISTEHLHLELDVFEKDFANIKKGQRITYTVPALGQTVYEGEVNSEGKEFNKDTKTVRIHGHLHDAQPNFVNDLFVNAKIWLNDNTTTGLPEDAIIRDGESTYVFVGKSEHEGKEFRFEKIGVVAGATEGGYTSVKLIDEVPEGMNIVTKGAYFVNAQSKAGELSHEH